MKADFVIVLVLSIMTTVVATRYFWPLVKIETVREIYTPRPDNVYGYDVMFFAMDPKTGAIVWGPEGAIIDNSYLINIDTQGKDEMQWSAHGDLSAYRYRIRFSKPRFYDR